MTNKTYLTIEEMINIPTLSAPAISNDGQRIAYEKRVTHWDDNIFLKHVWIYDERQGYAFPLTTGKTESTAPAWAQDSTTLAYLAPVGEGDDKKKQIFIKFPNQITGMQVTNAPEGVEHFHWTPDGEGFIYTATVPERKSLKQRKEFYADLEYIDKEYQRTALYYIEIEKAIQKSQEAYLAPKDLREKPTTDNIRSNATTNKQNDSTNIKGNNTCINASRNSADTAISNEVGSGSPNAVDNDAADIAIQLTDGEAYHVVTFAISPDGKRVVFRTVPSPNSEDTEETELYLLDLATKSIRNLHAPKPIEGKLLFSPEGQRIAYTRFRNGLWFDNMALEIMDLATGVITRPDLPIDEYIDILQWTAKGIFISWQDRTNIFNGLITEEGQLTLLIHGDDCYVPASAITLDCAHMVYIKATSNEPSEIYLDGQRITDRYTFYENRLRSQKQVIRWQSTDGTEIEGVLSTPTDFDESKQYPLLVIVHGGPADTSLPVVAPDRYYPIEQFVAKGFIVLSPNYRGSAGYGEAFRQLNIRNLGLGDYADVITGVDALIARGIADPEKVGVMGWSQGGYISAFAATYSDRFKAISVGAGISNWVTYYVNTDVHQFTRIYLKDTPWNDPEIYQQTSPMTYIKNACTPTLIQHGEKDTRVPVPNAYELYQGLRDVGVPVELVIFKGMSHGFSKPGQSRAIMKQNLLWFSHYLLGESLDGFYLDK